MPECFFAHLGGCEGRLVKAHLVPKSRIRQEIRGGNVEVRYHDGPELDADVRTISEDEIIWDSRCWRWMCGGVTGIGSHHGAYDAKQIRLDEWPADFLEYLDEYGISWIAEAYERGS